MSSRGIWMGLRLTILNGVWAFDLDLPFALLRGRPSNASTSASSVSSPGRTSTENRPASAGKGKPPGHDLADRDSVRGHGLESFVHDAHVHALANSHNHTHGHSFADANLHADGHTHADPHPRPADRDGAGVPDAHRRADGHADPVSVSEALTASR